MCIEGITNTFQMSRRGEEEGEEEERREGYRTCLIVIIPFQFSSEGPGTIHPDGNDLV